MKPKILLINPPIYDFAAYDFWLKPYGMLSVAGFYEGQADFALFDYLDRSHSFYDNKKIFASDGFGKGRFFEQKIPNPPQLQNIPRFWRRYGLPRNIFFDFLWKNNSFDFVFIQTVMTYWYPGVKEVIEDVRRFCQGAKIILGGGYATLCPRHAAGLGADMIVYGKEFGELSQMLGLKADTSKPALWSMYKSTQVGALKLADGCPFECSYCSVAKVYGKFKPRPLQRGFNETELLNGMGVTNVAFYDDALLHKSEDVLIPFLDFVLRKNIKINFHTPNAMNARFANKELAELMVRAGFKTFFLGFESLSADWHNVTGSKVYSEELAAAVSFLKSAGANPNNITAYNILGHPKGNLQQLEETIAFVNSLGIRGMLADFSPIPGTPDGEYCRKWIDLDEPLFHNKAAFPIILLGFDEYNRFKNIQRSLNRNLSK
ncbi:MAG: B12-binding domain-containing radical SAM protein [Phycisphaerae bacterium]|nr:B12-binding domain-containing radical SAM protein [Phycisphaerae bacterium]